ncbi:MAG: HEAT repeat domain-containing protein [Gemmataceae bacterium]|nr:HEAT repeat domain-containing protein [Gemmataceae bacterium]
MPKVPARHLSTLNRLGEKDLLSHDCKDMNPPPSYFFDLDQIGSSYLLLLAFVVLGIAAGLLFYIGVVGFILGIIQAVVQSSIRSGFRTWQALFSWAEWPVLLGIVLTWILVGAILGERFPFLAAASGTVLMLVGVTTCLAYIWIDVERYEVARGYKALHNPLKGQELAVYVVRYGRVVGMPLLITATVSLVGGFALLNQSFYETVGEHWFHVGHRDGPPGFADFLAYTLINLFRVVDLLGIAESYNFVHVTYVRQVQWPAATLLALFRSFFTLVLLEKIFSSVRRGRLLAETIGDFWSPHLPIHERARNSLPQHGPSAVRALLLSLRSMAVLTPEQRTYLPRIIADIGPAGIPILIVHLDDPNENVRAVTAGALGRLQALEAVPALVRLGHDPSDRVRQSVAEALGPIGGLSATSLRKNPPDRRVPRFPVRSLWQVLCRRKSTSSLPMANHTPLAVEALRERLTDPVVAVRGQAARSLGLIGPAATDAVPDLIGCLKDADESVRCQAAEALGLLRASSQEAVSALMALLEDPTALLRIAAARALGSLRKEAATAVPSLMALLHEHDESIRQVAAEALGEIGTLQDEAIESLTDGLDSQDTLVRARTAEVLGTIGAAAAEATPALAEALTDSNDRVRAKAAEALGKIGEAGVDAVPHLVRALRDKDNWVSALAAEALGEMGEGAADAIPGLVRSLRHVTPKVRANAAEALGKMGEAAQPAVRALETALVDAEDSVRSAAIRALGEIGHLTETATAAVLAALEDPNPEVRASAVEAVGNREELRSCGSSHLLHAVADANDGVKIEVAKALSRVVGDTSAVVAGLCQLLSDDNGAVQSQAALALGKLGTKAAAAGPALLQAVRTGEAGVREHALRAIAIIQPAEATAAFIGGLKSSQPEIRKLAMAGFVKATELCPEAIPDLVEALRDPEVQVRANAARVLSRLDPVPAEAVPALIECASDGNDSLRVNAALALRSASPGLVHDLFEHLLTDPNPRLQLIAAGFLIGAEADSAAAAEVLTAVLADPSVRLRRTALEVVQSLGDRATLFLAALHEREAAEENPELSGLILQIIEASADSSLPDPGAAEVPLPIHKATPADCDEELTCLS